MPGRSKLVFGRLKSALEKFQNVWPEKPKRAGPNWGISLGRVNIEDHLSKSINKIRTYLG